MLRGCSYTTPSICSFEIKPSLKGSQSKIYVVQTSNLVFNTNKFSSYHRVLTPALEG